MAHRPHPADLAQAAIIRSAIRYDVALFLGVGRFAHGTASTLAVARVEARRIKAEHPGNIRKPMIYAIDADGRSAFVADHFQP
ncbi:MAG: hypothetical protein HYX36_00570 [Rhizobiales bacterium]|nr:hypothetical protein [Hyphomicrobiales bacterium]